MARKGPLPRLTRRSGGSAALSESAETIDLTASPPKRPAVVSGIVSYATRADSESPKRPSAASGGLRRSSRTRGDSLPSVRVGKSSDSMAPKKGGVRCSPRTPADSPRIPMDSESLTVLENGHTNDQMAVENGSLRRSPRMVSNTLNAPPRVVENGKPTTTPVPVENRSLRSHPRTVTVQNGSSFDQTDIRPSKKAKVNPETNTNSSKSESECFFVGDPIPEEEARSRWPHRYKEKGKKNNGRRSTSNDDEDEVILDVKYHYCQASVCGSIFNLGDCAYIKGEEGKPDFVGRILEFFETLEGEYYIRVQWFFRADDTIMTEQAAFHDKKRLFYSDLKNDNLVDCIVSKVRVVQVPPSVDLKSNSIPPCDFYYDMKYSVEYSTFYTMETDDFGEKSDLSSSNCSGTIPTNNIRNKPIWEESYKSCASEKSELALLDLYSGCGGMSTGLCLGSHFAGVKLVTRWAVDSNQAACASMQLNHPETQVRNENVDDFFALLKEWEKLCKQYITNAGKTTRSFSNISKLEGHQIDTLDNCKVPNGEYEVLKLVDICYGDPTDSGKRGLKFKVRWKGYSPSDDTWEQIEELSKCKDRIQEFVREGFSSNILPLPGDADVLCGGPPCQGISGLNRHRNVDAPLDDEKNRQIVVFMDIVQFLKPKYVLMENVVDILKFAGGTLGRYALSRLVFMNYQARIGIMAAGCYGLPQFRLRTFFWGSLPFVKLPQFPLPTHDVIMKGGAPNEFERNLVAFDQDQPRKLEKALVLKDVLSDLPSVSCNDVREQMEYEKAPETDFQRYIRCSKYVMVGSGANVVKQPQNSVLYDHCPLQLHEDNCVRVSKIPRRKGASFRDLPGIIVKPDNSVDWDPTLQRILLASGRPLVPDFVTNFMDGKSTRPFARLWWDETVPTVLTNPSPHYQAILHPEQDRVLTVRENARLQGFPDYYRFCGTIKERYTQVGNAVAIPVGRALGYALGMAWLKQSGGGEQPLITLPAGFSLSHRIQQRQSSSSSGVQVCMAHEFAD